HHLAPLYDPFPPQSTPHSPHFSPRRLTSPLRPIAPLHLRRQRVGSPSLGPHYGPAMRLIDDAHVEAATRALLGAIDAGDGGTDEQRAVLAAVVSGYWQRPDLDLATLEPLEPDE